MKHRNPLAQYKDNMEYTYDQLADQFAIGRSVIQRAIEGAYYSLPPSIVGTLAYIEGKSEAQINLEYDLYVADALKEVTLPPVALNRHTTLEEFDVWATILLRINGVRFVGEVPHLSVARLLKLNTVVINNYYSGRTASIPQQVLERIDQIDELHSKED